MTEAKTYPPVLDACCGGRTMWVDHNDDRALFVDKRNVVFKRSKSKGTLFQVVPDMEADFTALPFPDNTFALVAFDPPHVVGKEEWKGDILRMYGVLPQDWRDMLHKGFAECFRVLRPEGVLIFKWAETQIALREVLTLTDVRPLFGSIHGKNRTTHWVTFLKPNATGEAALPARKDA